MYLGERWPSLLAVARVGSDRRPSRSVGLYACNGFSIAAELNSERPSNLRADAVAPLNLPVPAEGMSNRLICTVSLTHAFESSRLEGAISRAGATRIACLPRREVASVAPLQRTQFPIGCSGAGCVGRPEVPWTMRGVGSGER